MSFRPPELFNEETNLAIKSEIVDIFRELLQRLWKRLVGVIGEVPTATIFWGAMWETSRSYPFLTRINVDKEGVSVSSLMDDLNQIERSELRSGMLALVDNTVGLLTDMTGTILLGKVDPLVQEFKAQIKKEQA